VKGKNEDGLLSFDNRIIELNNKKKEERKTFPLLNDLFQAFLDRLSAFNL